MIFVVVVTNIADCNAVSIGDVWYVFPAELLHPREAFLRSSKCRFVLFMVDLCNRTDHYIFALWFLSFFFFSLPNLSGRRLDVYHTSPHGVALVRI